MTYRISAQRYNKRMDKIWATYKEQERQKDIIAKKIYKLEYNKLSDTKKRNVCHIWGDLNGI
jgi:hypothetical protein